ncbi:MAG: methyltransferase domain-containing protein [Nitrospirales bacterium]
MIKGEYGQAALQAKRDGSSCCGPISSLNVDPITSNLYNQEQAAGMPDAALAASRGGIDVLLSAKRVGPNGKAFGLDMTDEMLDLARDNQQKAGIENVEFLKGEMEEIPLPDDSVDVIISNCVMNLSPDKDRALGEAYRVLKPGGRFAISDIVTRGPIPGEIRLSLELWCGCVAGALEETDYKVKLAKAGFEAIDVEPTRIYRAEDAREFLAGAGLHMETVVTLVDGKFMSAFVRARKPLNAASACSPPRDNERKTA